LHTVSTVTVSNEQFLSGDRYGKPVTVAGELRLPRSTAAKIPVIVAMHGSGGINPSHDRWAQDLNAVGIGILREQDPLSTPPLSLCARDSLCCEIME